MKPALLAATLVLVGGSAVACGDGAPADASETEFCDSYNSLFKDVTGMTDASDEEIIAKIKEWGASMEETGTPEDISDEARAGFEQTVDMIAGLDDKATKEDFEKLDKDLTDEEKKQVEAFDNYTTDTCGSPLDNMEVPEVPTESPSVVE